MTSWRAFFSAAMLVSLAGCATTASVHTLQPIDTPLSRYTRAVVSVTSSPEVSWRDGAAHAETRLKFALLDKLRAAKKFTEVTDDRARTAADEDLKILLTLGSLGYPGSGGAWTSVGIGVGGVFSGGAAGMGVESPLPAPVSTSGMIVQVELLDAPTGRRVGYLDVTATSGDITAQAEAIADKIVEELARN